MLGEFGTIKSVTWVERARGRFSASALVEFEQSESTDAVVLKSEEEGLTIGNKEVKVSYAHPDARTKTNNARVAGKRKDFTPSPKPPGCLTIFLGRIIIFY